MCQQMLGAAQGQGSPFNGCPLSFNLRCASEKHIRRGHIPQRLMTRFIDGLF